MKSTEVSTGDLAWRELTVMMLFNEICSLQEQDFRTGTNIYQSKYQQLVQYFLKCWFLWAIGRSEVPLIVCICLFAFSVKRVCMRGVDCHSLTTVSPPNIGKVCFHFGKSILLFEGFYNITEPSSLWETELGATKDRIIHVHFEVGRQFSKDSRYQGNFSEQSR